MFRCNILLHSINFCAAFVLQRCPTTSSCTRFTQCVYKNCGLSSGRMEAGRVQGESCENCSTNGRHVSASASPPLFQMGRYSIPYGGSSEYYCPGGGAVVIENNGMLAACDVQRECPGDHICNPKYGLCCTRIRTCPRPAKTMLNAFTRKPIICQIKLGQISPCPDDGYCETKTGFCCKFGGTRMTPSPLVKSRPSRGQSCVVRVGCDGGAVCKCNSRGKCRCECTIELGYKVAPDGKTCERVRKRLKEKCKTDMECSSAYSECSSGGCRCKKGFQRDGRGGCTPTRYNCVNNEQPLSISNKVVTCSVRSTVVRSRISGLKFDEWKDANSTTEADSLNICPDDYYCVPLHDDALMPGFYKGFCCPAPTETFPVCPVGHAHETSTPPDFGCSDCPLEYYCHRDAVYTQKTICCPKPCISLEDIYHNGQCYPTAFYGDSCHVSAQCMPFRNSTDKFSQSSPLECVQGICDCQAGYSYLEGECKRVKCTIGLRGEPLVNRNNRLIRCARSDDCAQGHLCDPNTHVCCKGTNRCPKGYVETGQDCVSDRCSRANDLCFRDKSSGMKLCCTIDDGSS